METKLVRVSDTHYVIVDMSEKGRKGYNYNFALNKIDNLSRDYDEASSENSFLRKITHSTKPLESTETVIVDKLVFNKIKSISLSEIEKLINRDNIEKMASEYAVEDFDDYAYCGFMAGFKAHQEFVQNKLTNSGNMNHLEWIYDRLIHKHGENPNCDYMHKLKNIIDSIYLRSEWDIEFIYPDNTSLEMSYVEEMYLLNNPKIKLL